ncbi:hypothetical protein [Dyadobacter sp. BHUBP1]|uniref:hypothetical protein n=1 Tax=Dyadobacter sp. BHUBP1 TaxID=3424178 RepID=UPI003D32C327
MKFILLIGMLIIVPCACAQVIQQANTYKHAGGTPANLPFTERIESVADTTAIRTNQGLLIATEIPVRKPVDTLRLGNKVAAEGNFGSVNNEIKALNEKIDRFRTDLGSIRAVDAENGEKISELRLLNQSINKDREKLRSSLSALQKVNSENIAIRNEIGEKLAKVEQDNNAMTKEILELKFSNLKLIKSDYSRFYENARLRIAENQQLVKNLSDSVAIREQSLFKMDSLFGTLTPNKETRELYKLIHWFQGRASTLKQRIKSAAANTKTTESLSQEIKASEALIFKMMDMSNYVKIYGETILPRQDSISKSIAMSGKEINELTTEMNRLNGEVNMWRDKINEVADKNKPTEASGSAENYTVIGGFNKMLNERGALTPTVTVLGNRAFGNPDKVGNAFGQIKLFMGGTADNLATNTSYNFFSEYASSYGLMINIGYGISSQSQQQKKLKNKNSDAKSGGFALSFSYLSKRLKPNDSTSIDPGVLHWKTGGELIIFPNNILSIRSNINGMFVGSQFEKIKENYKMAKDVHWFIDAGLSTYLSLAENQKLFLRLNLDFIITTKDMKDFINTKDKFIPQFKVDIVKNF